LETTTIFWIRWNYCWVHYIDFVYSTRNFHLIDFTILYFTIPNILFTDITIYSEFMFVLVWVLFHYVLRLLFWCSNFSKVTKIAAKSSWVLRGAPHDKQWRTRLSLSWIFIYKLPSTFTSQGRFLRDFLHSPLVN
jgi:hypothetical protein